MEVVNLIQGAQEAMDRGDYRLAIAATNHVLAQYPNCLAAHRMLGEAYLERADQKSAITHFERALAIDPLNVVSRLGMGVAAEETRDFKAAYAHYLHAWELNPALDQVRDELVRIRGLLNVEDKLHPTRAGLAGVHTRSGQFGRAIGEWRTVLAAEPESRRARTSIAELLWRQGDDHAAAIAAREALRGCPENARALALLADLERRRNGTNLDEFSQRYVAADPTGDVIALLVPWRNDADFAFLQNKSLTIDDFDFAANASRDTGALSGKRIATASLAASQVAAPDLWDNLVRDLSGDELEMVDGAVASASGDQNTAPLAPFDFEPFQESNEVAAAVFGASLVTAPLQSDVEAAAEPVAAQVEAFSLEAVAEPQNVAEIELSAEEEAGLADLMGALGEPAEFGIGDAAMLVAAGEVAHAANGNHTSNGTFDTYGATVPFNADPLMGTVELTPTPDEPAAYGGNGDAMSLDLPDDLTGFETVAPVASAEPAAFDDPFVTADGRIDLTVGWDDLDRQLEAATPDAAAEGAFADLLAELNVDGIQPFDVEGGGADDDAWEPLTADDFATPAQAPVAAAPEPVAIEPEPAPLYVDELAAVPFDIAAAAAGEHVLDPLREADPIDFAELNKVPELNLPVAEIDDDILSGIPQMSTSGYTEILRNIDEESPFVPYEPVPEDVIDSPDAVGAPLLFEELIEVTSKDGTGPLETDLHADIPDNPFDFSGTDLEAAMPPLDPEPMAYDLEGIVPFDTGALGGADLTDGQGMSFDDVSQPVDVPVAGIVPLVVAMTADEPSADEPLAAVASPDMTPFAFDDAPVEDVVDAQSSDFADLNAPVDVAAIVVEDEVLEAAEPVSYTSLLRESELPPPPPSENGIEPAWAGREGLGPVAHKVLWPPFVNQTSSLIDRGAEADGLFARIAQQKDQLIQMGVVNHVRSLRPQPEIVQVPVEAPAPVAAAPVEEPVIREIVEEVRPLPVMSDQTRKDLMAMRARLFDDNDSAGEIAETIEKAMNEGLKAPLAQRVLGEAYLKLGQVERAAAQFRQAMLARRRS